MSQFRPAHALLFVCLFLCLHCMPLSATQREVDADEVVGEFLLLILGSDQGKQQALDYVEREWQPGFSAMLVEALGFNSDPAFAVDLIALLESKSGQELAGDIQAWQRWLWNAEEQRHPGYAEFKSALYGLLDPAFEGYFSRDRASSIRLDEILWGGVGQDGIPPLHKPEMLSASRATYLADSDIVFGLSVNGDVRAYPRRILGWHELFLDEIGGMPVAGVYCTLCGTMMVYKTRHGGVDHELGTSGFLYRSNKLMYDRATQSLWSTFWGKPVVGPLVGQGIELQRLAVVTTTWARWRERHPDTRVLSLATGYSRDYAEGSAYRDYFATDRLMFQVPQLDSRLKNKDEVLGLVYPESPREPLAVSVSFLASHSLYQARVGTLNLLILTDDSGASRVYEAKDIRFDSWDGEHTAVDSAGVRWGLTESRLRSDKGGELLRLPAQRAFWFGWFAAYPGTRLVH